MPRGFSASTHYREHVVIAEIEALVSSFESGALSRRQFLQGVVAATAAPHRKTQVRAVSLNHVSLAVRDVDASRTFYERVLGMAVVSRQPNGVNLGLGGSFLGLYDIQPKGQINHFCVGVSDFDLQDQADELKAHGVEPLIRQDRPELYFADPDGITVQIADADYRG
jgi:catechol 2,3-dioxygenase-like lactoylglutathione lyase family enzyme